MEKIKELIKKVFTKEIIFYAIFGVLTTVVNLATFYILTSLLHLEDNFSNKDLVFHSEAYEFGEKVVEFCKFILGRLFTMVVEYIGCALLFKYAPISTMISKCIVTVIVIILNFFISKFFAFKKIN